MFKLIFKCIDFEPKALYILLVYINNMEIIKKVFQNKSNGQKSITIPARSGINVGDHVIITKVELKTQKEK